MGEIILEPNGQWTIRQEAVLDNLVMEGSLLISPAGTAPSMIENEEMGINRNYHGQTRTEVVAVEGGFGYYTKKVKDDPISHPAHYTHGRIECIEFLEDQQLGFHEALAVKYICRARFKGVEIQDLKKAIWYLSRKVELLEKEKSGQ